MPNIPNGEFDQNYALEQLRRSYHPLRRMVKHLYINNILTDVLDGPAIDFGCGAGQLLSRLPDGSMGLEINPYLIASLRERGLKVLQARANMEDFELVDFAPNFFKTLIISHVLEHLQNPVEVLSVLLRACKRIGVKRVIIVVPCAKGFDSDSTHKSFIDQAYLEANFPIPGDGFKYESFTNFPLPLPWLGRFFVYQELKILLDHTDD
jgi:SAM-dependent methyltransferase